MIDNVFLFFLFFFFASVSKVPHCLAEVGVMVGKEADTLASLWFCISNKVLNGV